MSLLADIIIDLHKSATQNGRTMVWRGLGCSTWVNTPSLVRQLADADSRDRSEELHTLGRCGREPMAITNKALIHEEYQLLASAARYPAPEMAGHLLPEHRFALLQHHGTATGLLDVTRDPLVALYFAASSEMNATGVVQGFDVTGWQVFETESGPMASPSEYFNVAEHGDPFLVAPTRPDLRMRSQRGLFMRCPVDEDQGNGAVAIQAVVSRDIPFPWKEEILESLRKIYGISHEYLFPDLAGFAKLRSLGPPKSNTYCRPGCPMHLDLDEDAFSQGPTLPPSQGEESTAG